MKLLIAAILVAQATVSCCDPKHAGYAENQKAVIVCSEKGGITITEPRVDDGGHAFNILKQCILPCYGTLNPEKR